MLLYLLTVLAASAHVQASKGGQRSPIDWTPCKSKGKLPVTCANLTVPLDYSDKGPTNTIALSLVKVAANKEPCKGSILFNPGGPGASGTDMINSLSAEIYLLATGGHFNLIGFDTRGTGNTLPISCYKDDIDRQLALAKTPLTSTDSDGATAAAWAAGEALAANCHINARRNGPLVGTAFVARDMIQIVDALQEDGLLRYLGISYGTVLGQTVAAMFPDRMDKVVLDGNLNVHDYYAGRNLEQLTDSDKVFEGFLEGCISAPAGECALAHPKATAVELSWSIDTLRESLRTKPYAAGPPGNHSVVSYGRVKSVIMTAMYNPQGWTLLSKVLAGLIQGNGSAFVESEPDFKIIPPLESLFAIQCGDNSMRSKSID